MELEYVIEVEERSEDGVMHTVVTLGRYGDWGEAVDTARALSGCLKCDLDVVVYEYGEYENGIEVYRL